MTTATQTQCQFGVSHSCTECRLEINPIATALGFQLSHALYCTQHPTLAARLQSAVERDWAWVDAGCPVTVIGGAR